MTVEDKTKNQTEDSLLEEPNPSNNEKYLDKRLKTLRNRYSYKKLSTLSALRLGALDTDDKRMSEEDKLYKDFRDLRARFPDHSEDSMWQNLKTGSEYHALAPLTREQNRRIRECEQECSRNLDRARQDALEREDLSGVTSRLAAWLVEFADAVTPVLGRQN